MKPVKFSLVFTLSMATSIGLSWQARAESLALKNGETANLGALYWQSNCRSVLTAPPVAEILDGPPQLSVAVKEAQVLPRRQQCAKEIPGALLSLTANDVKDPSKASITIRIKFATKDGERQQVRKIDVSLFP